MRIVKEMWQAATVGRIREEAEGIRSVELVPAAGVTFTPFAPGAHVDVLLAPSVVRPYSLINTIGGDGHYHIAVKLEPASRGGSRRVHEIIEGEELAVGQPKNNFSLHPSAPSHLLIGGGIGVTPILGMARHLARNGGEFGLLYFGRAREQMAFLDEITGPDLSHRSRLHIGLEASDVETTLADTLSMQTPGTHVYVCGPAPLMALTHEITARHPGLTLHREHFSADPGPSDAVAGEFRVVLKRSGRSFSVPADRTIIEVLAAGGVTVPTSCEQGVCGTCQTRVLAGRPDHRDLFLSDEEQATGDTMLVCVSRSLDPELVLDL